MPKKQVSFLEFEQEIKRTPYENPLEEGCVEYESDQVVEDTIRVENDIGYSYEALHTNDDQFDAKTLPTPTKDPHNWWGHVFKPSRNRSCKAKGGEQVTEVSPIASKSKSSGRRLKSRFQQRFSMSAIDLSPRSPMSDSYPSKGVLVNLADPVHEDTQDIDDFIESGPRRHSVLYRTFESHSTLVLTHSRVNTVSAQDSDIGDESDVEVLMNGVQRVALESR
jgi:hypothetical protein